MNPIFSFEEAGDYTIYINSSLQVWDGKYVETVPYGLRGSFEGGNNWSTTVLLTKVDNNTYEGTITAAAGAKFKVVKVRDGDINYIEEWIGIGGNDVVLSEAGTYKITFTVSTKAIVFSKI